MTILLIILVLWLLGYVATAAWAISTQNGRKFDLLWCVICLVLLLLCWPLVVADEVVHRINLK